MNQPKNPLSRSERFRGLLIGTAVGDSLGLPGEGLSRRRIANLWRGHFRQRFLFGRGMVSDDTEHAIFVGQALLVSPRDADKFTRALAWKLRLWLLGAPAGIGLATLRSIIRLWLGVPAQRSGVKSAGNGAAMRAPLLGLFFAGDEVSLKRFVEASSRMTHTDPRALAGALAVAFAARQTAMDFEEPSAFVADLEPLTDDATWRDAIRNLRAALVANESVAEFAARLGRTHSVTGYVCHSVPVALFAWLRHRHDFRATVTECIACGGDADTTAAIAGALAGADAGVEGIPAEWRTRICEWPRSVSVLEDLGSRLSQAVESGNQQPAVRYFWPGLIARNALFFITVLFHGFRRLLPPF